jgi:hypothetical protein
MFHLIQITKLKFDRTFIDVRSISNCKMKLTSFSLLALSASLITARYVEEQESHQKPINVALEERRYLIKLMSGGTRWVTENEKWQLKSVRVTTNVDAIIA